MNTLLRSPFDDASGKEFLQWYGKQGGYPSAVYEVETAGTTLDTATPIPLGTIVVRQGVAGAGLRLPNAPVDSVLTLIAINNVDPVTFKLWPSSSDVTVDFIRKAPGAFMSIDENAYYVFQRISDTEWAYIK